MVGLHGAGRILREGPKPSILADMSIEESLGIKHIHSVADNSRRYISNQ
jgi:hypothetical protein